MTWIKTIPQREADTELREAMQGMRKGYPPEYSTEVPILKEIAGREQGGSISDSHSLIPPALYHSFSAFGAMMSPDLPLTRRQHEMIAATVSVLNYCFY